MTCDSGQSQARPRWDSIAASGGSLQLLLGSPGSQEEEGTGL